MIHRSREMDRSIGLNRRSAALTLRDLKLVEFSLLKFLSRVLGTSKSFLTSKSINRIESNPMNPRIEFIESDPKKKNSERKAKAAE